MCTTPSKPTLSIACAINLPVSKSLFADIDAICSNWPSADISSDMLVCSSFTTNLTASSICLLIWVAFSPLSKLFNPDLMISLANKVDVVVPSPALSPVVTAACLISNTPNSSLGSSSKIDLATVTPSFVDWGASAAPLNITTFLPLGPSVDTTASASLSIPLIRFFLAFLPYSILFSIYMSFRFLISSLDTSVSANTSATDWWTLASTWFSGPT